MVDLSGQQFGNYRLLNVLGNGGQASVYLGQHIRLTQKQAAIKILHAHLSQEDVDAFQREANTIVALSHPHIVTIHDFDIEEGVPFLVMDFYPDGTLRQKHPRGMRLTMPIVISYVQQVAEALQYAHDHRVIHRDVKPANMLVSKGGEIVLSDFGIATIAYSTASLPIQNYAGTAAYMAPEQIKQHPRRESDQYALAVVVYEWLSGKLPFTGTPQEIVIKHLAVEPPSLSQWCPNVSPTIEQVIFKALAKDPKERFSSVQEFSTALVRTVQESADGTTNIATPSLSHEIVSLSMHNSGLSGELVDPLFTPVSPIISNSPPAAVGDIGSIPLLKTDAVAKEIPPPIRQQAQPSRKESELVQQSPPAKSVRNSLRLHNMRDVQPVHNHTTSSIDEEEVLRLVRLGKFPDTWRVFPSSLGGRFRWLMSTLSWLPIVGGMALVFIGVVLALLPLDVGAWCLIGGLILILVTPVFFFFCALWVRGYVLVLMPNGFVCGKNNWQKVSLVVNFREALNIRAVGKHIYISYYRKEEVEQNCSWFAASEIVVRDIINAYKDFRLS